MHIKNCIIKISLTFFSRLFSHFLERRTNYVLAVSETVDVGYHILFTSIDKRWVRNKAV